LEEEKMKIYHNPRCSKSRETLALLREKGFDPVVVEYLKHPPTVEELREIIQMLGIRAQDLLRKGESIYKELYKGKALEDAEWIKIMVNNPVLIERPIVVYKKKATIGRPPVKVINLL
jgi:arsenate reductase